MARSAFGRRLKEIFDNATNKHIAAKIGVSAPAVQNYLDGRVPPAETLIKIMEVTDCDLHWLLTGRKRSVSTRSQAIFDEELLEQRIREIVREEIAAVSPVQDLGAVDEFDLASAIERYDDPHKVMAAWFLAEGRKLPDDYGIIFFEGWETFSREQKLEAVLEAKKALDRRL